MAAHFRILAWRIPWTQEPGALQSRGLQRVRHNCVIYRLIQIETIFRASLVTQSVRNLPAIQETGVRTLGWEDPSGEGNGNPLQYSCLGRPLDRGAWWATVHGVPRVRHDLVTKPPPNNLSQLPTQELSHSEQRVNLSTFLRTFGRNCAWKSENKKQASQKTF